MDYIVRVTTTGKDGFSHDYIGLINAPDKTGATILGKALLDDLKVDLEEEVVQEISFSCNFPVLSIGTPLLTPLHGSPQVIEFARKWGPPKGPDSDQSRTYSEFMEDLHKVVVQAQVNFRNWQRSGNFSPDKFGDSFLLTCIKSLKEK